MPIGSLLPCLLRQITFIILIQISDFWFQATLEIQMKLHNFEHLVGKLKLNTGVDLQLTCAYYVYNFIFLSIEICPLKS